MHQYEAYRQQAQRMVEMVLDTRLVHSQHIRRQLLLQPMRAEGAQSHAKKCIDRAERKKDTCHWRIVRNYFLKNRSEAGARREPRLPAPCCWTRIAA